MKKPLEKWPWDDEEAAPLMAQLIGLGVLFFVLIIKLITL